MASKHLFRILCASAFFILNSSFLIPNFARAQWWEAYSEKTGLVLSLHQTDSSYELYSPLQTSDPIPVSKWSLRNDTLRLNCGSIGLKMTLVRQDSLWVGNWRQGILKEDITFLPADTLYHLRRPQTPQPPYRFDEETVRRLLDKAWWDAPEGELPTVAEHIWDVEGFLSPNRP